MRSSVDMTAQDFCDLAHFEGERSKFFGNNRLNAIGQRLFRFVMNLHQQSIRAHSYRCPR